MWLARLGLLLTLLLLAAAARAEVEMVRVWPGYRTAESFISIGEYFGRPESNGKRILLRSQPEERGGYYWLLRLRSPSPVPAAVVEISVIRTGHSDAEVFRFPFSLPAGSHPVLAGLTGTDWAGGENARPNAWRVRVLDESSGEELVAEQSFLWALPEKH